MARYEVLVMETVSRAVTYVVEVDEGDDLTFEEAKSSALDLAENGNTVEEYPDEFSNEVTLRHADPDTVRYLED